MIVYIKKMYIDSPVVNFYDLENDLDTSCFLVENDEVLKKYNIDFLTIYIRKCKHFVIVNYYNGKKEIYCI